MKTKLISIFLLGLAWWLTLQPTFAQTWQPAGNAPSNNWVAVASSADGLKLVGAIGYRGLYVSTNGGTTWKPTPVRAPQLWQSVASSTNGNRLAAIYYGGPVFISTNSGTTWTSNTAAPSCYAVASSGDGSKLAAIDSTRAVLFISTNFGLNWTQVTPPATPVTSVCIPTDGSRLLATVAFNSFIEGSILYSTNWGATWVSKANAYNWNSIAASSNGIQMVAVASHRAVGTAVSSGVIFTWTNSSLSTSGTSNNVPDTNWSSVVSSADGNTLVAAGSPGFVYCSTNAGTTWASNSTSNNRSLNVRCISADGRRVFATSGGSLYTSTNSGTAWEIKQVGAGWTSVVSSPDGTKLAASSGGKIYTSTDGGKIWAETGTPIKSWASVATSSDGIKLVAASIDSGLIHSSTDAGLTWATNNSPTGDWSRVISSADGARFAAVEHGNFQTRIYYSTNSGAAWFPLSFSNYWSFIAASPDGSKMAAIGGGLVYISANSGTNWANVTVPTSTLKSLALSADGSRLVAGGNLGVIYTSADSGLTWISNNVPKTNWTSVATSADGSKLVAVASGGLIYSSVDAGASWQSNSAPNAAWASVASSADGTKLITVASSGEAYAWQYAPTLQAASGGGNYVLAWPDSAFTNLLTLQSNTDLTTTNWTDVGSPIIDDGTNKSVTLPAPATNVFFRLKQP
ncbi:MAG: hypothetical protein RLZZ350_887 [Verrucomicrobiota bacterium]